MEVGVNLSIDTVDPHPLWGVAALVGIALELYGVGKGTHEFFKSLDDEEIIGSRVDEIFSDSPQEEQPD